MPRFVISTSRGGPTWGRSFDAAHAAARHLGVSPLNAEAPTTKRHRLLIECEEEEVRSKLSSLPGSVVVEREIAHTLSATLDVFISGTSIPLPHVPVSVILASASEQRVLEAATDTTGYVRLEIPEAFQASFVISMPVSDFWWSLDNVSLRNFLHIRCEPLPRGPLGWWHDAVGIRTVDLSRGKGIRVGIIDSGVAEHVCLREVVHVGSFLDGQFDAATHTTGNGRHGTHVAGLVAAIPAEEAHFAGMAPGASVYSACAFGPEMTASQIDLANAIESLVTAHHVDLINMSLSAPLGSTILRDAILDALDEGTVCVCAAGNEGGPLLFPSAWPETIAVGAVGHTRWGTPNSVARHHAVVSADRIGNFDFFSPSFGCCDARMIVAPGVGIISTVPSELGRDRFGELSGTSMAAPIACGTIAALLAATGAFHERSASERVQIVSQVLDSCRSVGLRPELEGKGIPFLGRTNGYE
jgi:subtilisin